MPRISLHRFRIHYICNSTDRYQHDMQATDAQHALEQFTAAFQVDHGYHSAFGTDQEPRHGRHSVKVLDVEPI